MLLLCNLQLFYKTPCSACEIKGKKSKNIKLGKLLFKYLGLFHAFFSCEVSRRDIGPAFNGEHGPRFPLFVFCTNTLTHLFCFSFISGHFFP